MGEEATFTDLAKALEVASGTLKEISSVLGGYLAVSASPREVVALVEEALSVAAVRRAIEHAESARALLGERFRGLETDFAPIHAVIDWSQAIRYAGLPVEIERGFFPLFQAISAPCDRPWKPSRRSGRLWRPLL